MPRLRLLKTDPRPLTFPHIHPLHTSKDNRKLSSHALFSNRISTHSYTFAQSINQIEHRHHAFHRKASHRLPETPFVRTSIANNAAHSDICKIILAIFLPPLGVFFERGCGADLLINILLTILGYIPGIIHALYVTIPLSLGRAWRRAIANEMPK